MMSRTAFRKSSHSVNGSACLETWFKKSSRSNANGTCVEAAHPTADTVLVRDSKDVAIPGLSFTPAAWTAFWVCLSAWLAMSFAVARAEYRRTRAKALGRIEDRMDSLTVATIRSQAHRDAVHNAKVMFFVWPLYTPVAMFAELVKMIVIGRPAKTTTEINWETAHSLRETQRRIAELEDQNRHDQLIADDPTGPRPHPDCRVCGTVTYPVRSMVDDPLPPGYNPKIHARCTATTCAMGDHANQGSHIVSRPMPVPNGQTHGPSCALCKDATTWGQSIPGHPFIPVPDDRSYPGIRYEAP